MSVCVEEGERERDTHTHTQKVCVCGRGVHLGAFKRERMLLKITDALEDNGCS